MGDDRISVRFPFSIKNASVYGVCALAVPGVIRLLALLMFQGHGSAEESAHRCG